MNRDGGISRWWGKFPGVFFYVSWSREEGKIIRIFDTSFCFGGGLSCPRYRSRSVDFPPDNDGPMRELPGPVQRCKHPTKQGSGRQGKTGFFHVLALGIERHFIVHI